MKSYKIINRLRFFISVSLLITVIVLASFTLAVSARNDAGSATVADYVEEGDTLWSLSMQYVRENMDVRDYIKKVMEVNNLQSANIKPGDMLYFPIYD